MIMCHKLVMQHVKAGVWNDLRRWKKFFSMKDKRKKRKRNERQKAFSNLGTWKLKHWKEDATGMIHEVAEKIRSEAANLLESRIGRRTGILLHEKAFI